MCITASLALITLSMAVRLWVGVSTGNGAVAIEGIHALLDVVVTLAVMITLKLIHSRIAKRLPYGLYKLEDLVTLILAGILLLLAAELGLKGLSKSAPPPSLAPAIAQAISLPPLAASAYLKLRAAKIANSPSLRADGIHTIGDVAEGAGVAAGLYAYLMIGSTYAYKASIIIAIAGIITAAYEAGHDSLLSILDIPRERWFIESLRQRVEESFPDIRVEYVKARWAGPVIFVEMGIRTHPLSTIEEASIICRRISRLIKNVEASVADVVIRVNPTVRRNFKVCIPQDEAGLDKPISKHFGKARYFTIIEIKDLKPVRIQVIENIVKGRGGGVEKQILVGARISELLYKNGVTDIIVLNIGEIAFSLLLRHRIVLWRAEGVKMANQLINEFINFDLTRLSEPTREESWAAKV